MTDDIEHQDLVAFAASRGGRVTSTEFRGIATLHQWECGRGHVFDASPRLLIHGGYWCPECTPTVDDASGWNWDFHAEADPLLAKFHRARD